MRPPAPGAFGGLGKTRGVLWAGHRDCALHTATGARHVPIPRLCRPLESCAGQSNQTPPGCQWVINDQQLRNCPHGQFGCCLTCCSESSDILLQPRHGAAGQSHRAQQGKDTLRVHPPPKPPCDPAALSVWLGAPNLGDHNKLVQETPKLNPSCCGRSRQGCQASGRGAGSQGGMLNSG